jgi:hypothetical protein
VFVSFGDIHLVDTGLAAGLLAGTIFVGVVILVIAQHDMGRFRNVLDEPHKPAIGADHLRTVARIPLGDFVVTDAKIPLVEALYAEAAVGVSVTW